MKYSNNRKLRILFVHDALRVGGAEELRRIVVEHIDKDRYDVEVCCIEEVGPIGGEIQKLGIPVACLHTKCKSYNLRATWRLYRLLKRKKYDIVQTSLFLTNLHGRIAAILAGVPLRIIEEHSVCDRFGKRLTFLYRYVDQFLSRFTHVIICCADVVRRHIIEVESVDPGKFRVIHNGIDLKKIDASVTDEDLAKLRREFGLDEEWPVLGNVGSFAPRKGKEYLVAALSNIIRVFLETRLVLVGDASTEHGRWLKARFLHEGLERNVVFIGPRRDIGPLLRIFDLYVSPSVHDAMPMAILEAMAAGLPVVAAKVDGVPEVVLHGETGLLVPSRDGEAIADAVIELLKDPARAAAFGRAGRERILRKFTISNYLAELEATYKILMNSLLGSPSRSSASAMQ